MTVDAHDFGVNDDLLDLSGVGRFESKEKFAQRADGARAHHE